MNETRRRLIVGTLKFFDLVLIVLSFSVASVWMFYAGRSISIERLFAVRVKLSDCVIFALAVLASHAMFVLCGIYESRRLSTKFAEVVDVLKAVTLATFSLALVAAVFRVKLMTPRFFLLFFVTCFVTVATSRLLLRYTLARIRRRGHNLHHILILGTNTRAVDFARRIEASRNAATGCWASWMTTGPEWTSSKQAASSWPAKMRASPSFCATTWWTR